MLQPASDNAAVLGPVVSVRLAAVGDAEELASLWLDMQQHYGKPVIEAVAQEAALAACRANTEGGFAPRTLVAMEGERMVGAVILVVSFPADMLTKALYIRDLYVTAARRRQGVGRALLRSAARLTAEQGFSALDWTTEASNDKARGLYEGEGATLLHRVYFRLRGAELKRIAAIC